MLCQRIRVSDRVRVTGEGTRGPALRLPARSGLHRPTSRRPGSPPGPCSSACRTSPGAGVDLRTTGTRRAWTSVLLSQLGHLEDGQVTTDRPPLLAGGRPEGARRAPQTPGLGTRSQGRRRRRSGPLTVGGPGVPARGSTGRRRRPRKDSAGLARLASPPANTNRFHGPNHPGGSLTGATLSRARLSRYRCVETHAPKSP